MTRTVQTIDEENVRIKNINVTVDIARTLVYNFLVEFITNNGYPPTVREIGEGVGIKSTDSVYRILGQLDMLGLIHMEPKKTRAIKVNGYEFRKIAG